MANMSDAFGNITIYAASVDVLIDLIQCHLKYEEGAYYSTSLDLFENVSPENRGEIIKIVEKTTSLIQPLMMLCWFLILRLLADGVLNQISDGFLVA